MNYTTWLRRALIVGLFLTLLIPFIIANGQWFPGMFFPFITGKNFAFRILVEVLFGLYVLLALKDPQYRPRFSWVLVAVGLFTLWAGVATVFSVDPIKSFWSNFERMEGYLTVLHLFAYFLVMSAVLNAEKLWTWFLRASVAASALMGCYGLLQVAGVWSTSSQSGPRLDTSFGNATYLAVYMLFSIFFALVLLKRDWSNVFLRWTYGAIIALDAFVLLFTETRGTLLGLVGGLIAAAVYLLLSDEAAQPIPRWLRMAQAPYVALLVLLEAAAVFLGKIDLTLTILIGGAIIEAAYLAVCVVLLYRGRGFAGNPLRTWAAGALAVIVILGGSFFALRHTPVVEKVPGLQRLASISLEDRTTQSRFLIWQMAGQGFLQRPVAGWGQENFNFVFNKYYNPALYNQEQWFDRAHNAFIDWAMNAGAPGFLLFLSLFLFSLWTFARARGLSAAERAALFGLVVAYGFHELFVFDDIVSYIQFFTVLALVHFLSRRELPATLALSRPASEHVMAIAAPIVAVAVVAGIWTLNVPGIASAGEIIQAIQPPASASGLSDSLTHFEHALARSPLGRQEETEQLAQFATGVARISGISPEIVQNVYTAAHDAMAKEVKERPGDARLELFFGAFLDQFGQYSEAKGHIDLARQFSPGKQTILFELGINNRLPAGDRAGALQALKEAYELDTSYDQARAYYATALYENGQSAQADALIQERYGTLAPDDDTLLQGYFITKQYGRAEAIVQARIARNPSDTQSRVQLAQIFYAQGDKQDAIATLQDASKVVTDPSLAAQIQQMIEQAKQ